jgi:hypothetical protein
MPARPLDMFSRVILPTKRVRDWYENPRDKFSPYTLSDALNNGQVG